MSCDDELCRYYIALYKKQYPYLNGEFNKNIIKPVWGAHISFVRSSDFIHKKLWGLDKNKIIEFEYEPEVQDNGTYFWLRIHCPYLLDLRERLRLNREPRFGLHLTIGRI